MIGWQTKKLGDVLDGILGGGTPSKENAEYWNGSIAWASVKDITRFDPLKTQDYITEEGLKNSSSRLIKAGTLIMPTRMALGFTVQFAIDVAINQDLKALYLKEIISKDYLKYWFESKRVKIERMGTGSTVDGIQVGDLKSLKISLPEKPEQERIVSVLETWDEYLELLNKKIALKERLKKGLMQQLLTGKKRLTGFKDEWVKNEIGSIIGYEQPNKYIVSDTNYISKGIPVLTANKSFILGYTNEKHGIYDASKEDVIIFDDFTMSSRIINFYFKIKSSAIKILKPIDDKTNIRFIYERMQLIPNIIGEHKRNYISEYQYNAIGIPNRLEQNAIADVSINFDKTISILRLQIDDIKRQKEYLLKNLITGTIRTPENITKIGETV